MKYKILAINLCLFLCAFSLKAQNLIKNGGFEEYSSGRPVGWYFARDLNFDAYKADKRSGRYSARVWANSGTFSIVKDRYDEKAINIKPGAEYKLSYWYKGNLTKDYNTPIRNIVVIISWFKDGTYIKRDYLDKEMIITSPTEWQEKVINIVAPNQANQMGISFKMESGKGYLLLDDVSMVFVKDGDLQKINPPTGLYANNFQREIELHWDKESDDALHWEVSVNGNSPVKTYTNSYTVEGLEPNTSYKIKVRSVKNDISSEYTDEITQITSRLGYLKEDPDRVPHLRTFNEDIVSSEVITLYFTDLFDKNAKITYFSDGIEIKPNGNQLTFPKKGKQKFKVIIEESPEYIWETEYDLTVK